MHINDNDQCHIKYVHKHVNKYLSFSNIYAPHSKLIYDLYSYIYMIIFSHPRNHIYIYYCVNYSLLMSTCSQKEYLLISTYSIHT